MANGYHATNIPSILFSLLIECSSYYMFVRNDELLRCKACAVSRYCSRGCQARNCF